MRARRLGFGSISILRFHFLSRVAKLAKALLITAWQKSIPSPGVIAKDFDSNTNSLTKLTYGSHRLIEEQLIGYAGQGSHPLLFIQVVMTSDQPQVILIDEPKVFFTRTFGVDVEGRTLGILACPPILWTSSLTTTTRIAGW